MSRICRSPSSNFKAKSPSWNFYKMREFLGCVGSFTWPHISHLLKKQKVLVRFHSLLTHHDDLTTQEGPQEQKGRSQLPIQAVSFSLLRPKKKSSTSTSSPSFVQAFTAQVMKQEVPSKSYFTKSGTSTLSPCKPFIDPPTDSRKKSQGSPVSFWIKSGIYNKHLPLCASSFTLGDPRKAR